MLEPINQLKPPYAIDTTGSYLRTRLLGTWLEQDTRKRGSRLTIIVRPKSPRRGRGSCVGRMSIVPMTLLPLFSFCSAFYAVSSPLQFWDPIKTRNIVIAARGD